MALLYGKHYTRQQLLRSVGDISQICGSRLSMRTEGPALGMSAADVWTGSGLEYTINTGRGMGIGAVRFKGASLGWSSSTGDIAAPYYDPRENQADRSNSGGLMHLCGLRQVGAPCEDNGETLGLHGRIAHIPARNVHSEGVWAGDEYSVSVCGTLHETAALGENLVLSRTVRSWLGRSTIEVNDELENCGHDATELMILYHTNFGFPLLDEGTLLKIPSLKSTDALKGSNAEEAAYAVYAGPEKGAESRIYFHEPASKDNQSCFALYNPNFGEEGLGVLIEYDRTNLPNIIQWINPEYGRNVMEVGPSNCKCFGRKYERDAGTLQYIQPGEIKKYTMKISVLRGAGQIEDALGKVGKLLSER